MTTTIPTLRRFLAVPLVLVATTALASASEVRDTAGMFSPAAVRQAQAILDRSEQANGHPIAIETVDSLGNRAIQDVAVEHARRYKNAQVFVLLAKKESKFWILERGGRFNQAQQATIKNAFVSEFKRGDFDAGLIQGAEALASAAATLPSARTVAAGAPVRRGVPAQKGGGSGFTFILIIGGIVLAVLVGMRILGSLFGAGRGGYGAPGGMRPGMGGPGMGGPGMGYGGGGGGGGGFFSSLLGGIGGAMAGNWMYDQFRGRGHDAGYGAGDVGSTGVDPAPQENADWGGGFGGDWGGGGGGGGDWGGGGGGDWGGGGGDGGGGGGDW